MKLSTKMRISFCVLFIISVILLIIPKVPEVGIVIALLITSGLCISWMYGSVVKSNEEEKIHADKENRELISNISHDLKTPITTIKGYVEGIMDGVACDEERLNRYIQTIYNKACDMDKLIDELMFYSNVDSDRLVYDYMKINVNAYFDSCVEEYEVELMENGIELIYESNLLGNTEFVVDCEKFKRVISNIFSNSVKYINHDNGIIRLLLMDADNKIQIDISDNGCGIEKNELPYIFDRFYRGDSARNSAGGGSGIGLSIVKKIVQDHNGKVWADSVVGKGTTIHIVLDKYIWR